MARAWDGEGKSMIRKGLRGRKEVKVMVKVESWPLFLVPSQLRCQCKKPKGNPGTGSPGWGKIVA